MEGVRGAVRAAAGTAERGAVAVAGTNRGGRDSAREVFDWYRPEQRQMLEEKGREVAMHLPGLLSGLRNSAAPAVGVDTERGHR